MTKITYSAALDDANESIHTRMTSELHTRTKITVTRIMTALLVSIWIRTESV